MTLGRAAKINSANLDAIKAKAAQLAANLEPIITALQLKGIVSLGMVADAPNEQRVLTPGGRHWHKSSVRNLPDRLYVKGAQAVAQVA